MTTKVALYCRVSTSTKDQATENQLRELTAYCDRMGYEVTKIYEDQISGAKSREKRPAYNELCKDAFLKRFDLVIAWDVSRFGRSLKEFVSFLADIDDRGNQPRVRIPLSCLPIHLRHTVPELISGVR